MNLQELVEAFAFHVAAQTEAMKRGMPGTGNRHARRYDAAFEQLRAHGSVGLEALSTLLTHSRPDVRTSAAAFLLRHRHREAEARAVLEEMSQQPGLVSFMASEILRSCAEDSRAPDAAAAPVEPAWVRRRGAAPPRPDPREPLALPASLEPHRARLQAALAPCILFEQEEGSPHSRGCRYGGLPLVPPGTPWPASPEGPLHFLGQLDFAELTACRGDALPELPREGLLAFFYDAENQPWGRRPEDRAFWKLLYVPAGEEVVPLQPPEALMDAERPILPPYRLKPALGLSLPDFWDRRTPLQADSWSEAQAEDYIELRRTLTGSENPHQLRGHPAWVQDDARLEAQLVAHGVRLADEEAWATPEAKQLEPGAAEWSLLWQVGSDEEALGFMWGDTGNLFVLIRDEDLRARRFEQAWVILQCG